MMGYARSHAWTGDRCRRCGMHREWPGARSACEGVDTPVERHNKGKLMRVRAALGPVEAPGETEARDNTELLEGIADPYPLPDEQLIAKERGEWVDRYFKLSSMPEAEARRIHARWNPKGTS
jgi:hypothetical protein